jgi:hypothetical protein
MNKMHKGLPWSVSFSYGKALQKVRPLPTRTPTHPNPYPDPNPYPYHNPYP